MTAFGLSPSRFAIATARSQLDGSRLKLSACTSAITGVAPSSATTSAVAQNVKAGQITAKTAAVLPLAAAAEAHRRLERRDVQGVIVLDPKIELEETA